MFEMLEIHTLMAAKIVKNLQSCIVLGISIFALSILLITNL